jgi:DNA-binding PadR family transcriptional regulator
VAHEVVSQSERPDKKVYALTDEGRAELHQWLTTPSRLDLDLRNETFLKLVLARRLAGGKTVDPLAVLAAERRSCFEELHKVTHARAHAERDKAPLQTLLLLDLAVLRLEAFLKWLERCEELLKKEKKR